MDTIKGKKETKATTLKKQSNIIEWEVPGHHNTHAKE